MVRLLTFTALSSLLGTAELLRLMKNFEGVPTDTDNTPDESKLKLEMFIETEITLQP